MGMLVLFEKDVHYRLRRDCKCPYGCVGYVPGGQGGYDSLLKMIQQ